MNTSYYTGANLIIRRNNYFYPRTIYEGHPLIIQKNCNCNGNGNNNGNNNNGNNNNSNNNNALNNSNSNNNNNKRKKTYKQICPLPANNGNSSSKELLDVDCLLEKEAMEQEYKYKEPISPPKKISEEFKDFYFYEKHWRPSSDSSSVVGGCGGTGAGIMGVGVGSLQNLGLGVGGTRGNHQDSGDGDNDTTSNWADKMSVEANIVEANGHRDLEIRLCYVK